MNIDEARELLKINKHSLDDACCNQAFIYNDIAFEFANSLSKRDELKELLARVDANLSQKFREEAVKKGDKITEAKLEELVLLSPDHITVYNRYNDAQKEAAEWQALKEAFAQRVMMIKELCQLHLSGYFTDNSVKTTKSDEFIAAHVRYGINQKRIERKS